MKVNVTLTLDDFLAWQEERLRPRTTKAPVSLLLGFLLIALGYAALRWAHPCDTGCGSSLGPAALALGFLATVAGAPGELLLRFLWNRGQAKKQRSALETEYERLYAEPRVFEADDSGWRIRMGSAENLRQWADLSAMSEEGRILTLTDRSASYPLPKSAFHGGELESLRRLCEQALVPASPLCSVSVSPTAADYSSAMAAHN